MNWFGIVSLIFETGIYGMMAYGSLAGAGAVLLGLGPLQLPKQVKPYAVAAFLMLSCYGFGWIRGDNDDIERIAALERSIELQRDISERAAVRAAERVAELDRLEQIENNYDDLLKAGTTLACPSDDSYGRQLRNIIAPGTR